MPLASGGCCDVDWMCESKYGCEPSGGGRNPWCARNWHWFQRYCNLAGEITAPVDRIDLSSTDLDGKQTHTRDRVVRMCVKHVHLLRPLRKFVSVPHGKLSVAAEFAVLRNAYIRYHEALASGQQVERLGGLEDKGIAQGVVSQSDRAVWSVTEMPASITGNMQCPRHLTDLEFRNVDEELRFVEGQLAQKCARLAVLEDRVEAAMSVERVSVGTQTDPVDPVAVPEPSQAMHLVLASRQRVAGLYTSVLGAHVRANHVGDAVVMELIPDQRVEVIDTDSDDELLEYLATVMDTGTEADPFREL